VRSLAKDIPLNWVPAGLLEPDDARRLVDHRLHSVAGRAPYRLSQATDSKTRQLLGAICAGLEQTE
jgi:hypothetical protein